ncbi:hypothetical protein ACT29H_06530 [Thermophagus sp. OGC60D27]|uniref:hypothetical protein n=1 Tax=Thermophagus sp. OGC60D27 TaxID=3458415 RepID=UPI004037A0C9
MKHNLINILLMVIYSGIMFISCKEEWEPSNLDFNADVKIKSFSINGIEGEIDQSTSTVNLNLPKNTDETKLVPDIEIDENATIFPEPGTPVDFSTSDKIPVTFRVINGNLYRDYLVTAKAISAKITSFVIGERIGIIDHNSQSITITVPYGTDLTKLSPNIEFTKGARIVPAPGSIIDFSVPVTYTLYFKGEEFFYQVHVKEGELEIPSLVIYDGEEKVPLWWTVGSAGDIESKYDNPLPDDINLTPYCASIWRNPQDDPWTGGGLGGLEIDPEKYSRFTLMVWKETGGDVQLEIQGEGAENQYLKVNYSAEKAGQWQMLEFLLPVNHGLSKITTILVAPHIDDTREDTSFFGHRMFWDQLIAHPK